ncbi:MAG: hypothetical protein MZV64_04575 [Ignavibacteriales bacterium]|nr:hypothetical protein [Ignavibacteriales bacterium]
MPRPRRVAPRADRRRSATALVPVNRKHADRRHHRGLPALPADPPRPDHLRVRAAGRRERHRRTTRGGWRRCCSGLHVQGEPDPAQPGGRHPVRAALRRAHRRLRPHRWPSAASR